MSHKFVYSLTMMLEMLSGSSLRIVLTSAVRFLECLRPLELVVGKADVEVGMRT